MRGRNLERRVVTECRKGKGGGGWVEEEEEANEHGC